MPPAPPGFADWAEFDRSLPAEVQGAAFACEDPDGVGSRLFLQRVPESKTVRNADGEECISMCGSVAGWSARSVWRPCRQSRRGLSLFGPTEVQVQRADGIHESCITMSGRGE